MKIYRVSDNGNGIEEDFDTLDDALAFAAETLDTYRQEALDNGEWSYEVDFISVYKMTHLAQVSKTECDEDDGTERSDYDILPVKESTNA